MDLLSQIISNQARAEIFRLLFNSQLKQMHLREIVRHSKLSVQAFQKELTHLKKLDLIIATKDGNRIQFKANTDHPLFKPLNEIVEKTAGVIENIRRILVQVKGIESAFIFGSYASGKEKSHSDIDLIVVGDVTLRTLAPLLKSITEISQREVNPHVYSEKTWKDKVKKNDHFINSVLNTDKIMLIGDDSVFS